MQDLNKVIFAKKNLNWAKVHYSSRYILIEPEGSQIPTQLIMDRQNLTILEESRDKRFVFAQQHQTKNISLLLGIIQIYGYHYLLVVQETYLAGDLLGSTIYHVASVDFIPFSKSPPESGELKHEIQHIIQQLKTQVFAFGFYFSLEYDITMSYQQFRSPNCYTVGEFYWNEYIQISLQHVSKKWRVPVIQGYFGSFKATICNKELYYVLVSRRSKYKSGTRFYARGLDDEGHVANSVETEQIFRIGKYVVSHTMIRGSVPVFWQQRSLSSNVKLTRNKDLTKVAFLKHFQQLHRRYGRILCFNLLQQKKSDEALLTKAYEQLFSECFGEIWEYCRYIYFDLHEAESKNKAEKLNLLISQKANVLQTFSYFMYDLESLTIKSRQNGIVRVNCLDCLGRTTALLHKIGFKVLQLALREHDVDLQKVVFARSVFEELDADVKDSHIFSNMYKYLWADNADFISKMYCGTESLSSNLARLGKASFFDMIDSSLVSLTRLYNYKFEDQLKQKSLDALLGHTKSVRKLSNNPETWNQFRKTYALKVFISTWNVNAVDPKVPKLQILFQKTEAPEVVVFCLQEMIALNTNNVLNQEQDGKISEEWKEVVTRSLQTSFIDQSFIFVDKVELVGIWMGVWINKRWKDSVRGVQKDMVRTGMGGKLGNKGGVFLRLKIYETSLCFANCHLEAGEGKAELRIENLVQIHEKAYQQNTKGVQNEAKVEDSDFKFLIGDLNFRIELSAELVRQKLKEYQQHLSIKEYKKAYKILDELLRHDQLTILRRSPEVSCKYVYEYKESPITFKPTYKFVKGGDEYTLKKNRVPSWCDRIMLWTDFSYHQRIYTNVPLRESDHQPVVSEYVVQIVKNANIEPGEEPDISLMKEFRESRFQEFEFI